MGGMAFLSSFPGVFYGPYLFSLPSFSLKTLSLFFIFFILPLPVWGGNLSPFFFSASHHFCYGIFPSFNARPRPVRPLLPIFFHILTTSLFAIRFLQPLPPGLGPLLVFCLPPFHFSGQDFPFPPSMTPPAPHKNFSLLRDSPLRLANRLCGHHFRPSFTMLVFFGPWGSADRTFELPRHQWPPAGHALKLLNVWKYPSNRNFFIHS